MKRNSDSLACTANLNPATAFFLLPLIALAFIFTWPDLADAKRVGGGGSFGSKPSYNSGYNKPVAPTKNTPSMAQQATPSPSRFGGFGGMLGGLLMGGLLGSMLFGGGFSGPGLMDILLLATGGFLLFKFMKSRKAATANSAPYAFAGNVNTQKPSTGGGWAPQRFEEQRPLEPAMPQGVDEQEFISGAKALYTRLQSSWDRRDLEDIRQFTSPEVHREIVRQATLDSSPGRTEILMVDARVLEVRTAGSETILSVLFDAMLREDNATERAEQVREVWHIRRDESSSSPQWTLEGIQQLEA